MSSGNAKRMACETAERISSIYKSEQKACFKQTERVLGNNPAKGSGHINGYFSGNWSSLCFYHWCCNRLVLGSGKSYTLYAMCIYCLLYTSRTLGSGKELRDQIAAQLSARFDLNGIPGFFYKLGAWRTCAYSGLLVPVRAADGRIQGVDVYKRQHQDDEQ